MKHRSEPGRGGYGAFVTAIIALVIAMNPVSPAFANDSLQLTHDYSEHCKPPEMPPLSRQLAESGLVRVKVRLAADGTIEETQVSHSSGFARLDEAALRSVRACRFSPPPSGGGDTPIEGVIKIRFSFDVRSWFPLRGVAEVEYLKNLVSGMSERCQARGAYPDAHIASNQAAWHQRNDPIALLIDDYKNLYEADIRQYTAPKDAKVALQTLDREMKSRSTFASSRADASFKALSAPQQQAYCQRYSERLAAGKFDLMQAIIAFPELESFIRKRAPLPS